MIPSGDCSGNFYSQDKSTQAGQEVLGSCGRITRLRSHFAKGGCCANQTRSLPVSEVLCQIS